MKKFIELCKKPLLITFAVVFVAFTVLLIAAYTTPFGNTYVSSQEVDFEGVAVQVEYKMTFVSDTEVETTLKVKNTAAELRPKFEELYNEEITEEEVQEEIDKMQEYNSGKGNYIKENGKLYAVYSDGESEERIELGDIKGYKIVGKNILSGKEAEYVCTSNKAPQIASIVLMSVSGALAIACVVILVLDKVGVLSKKGDKAEETPATTEAE